MEKVCFKSVDDDREVEFSIIDKAEVSNQMYLLVVEGEFDEEADAECYIMKAVGMDEEDLTFEIVEDENELKALTELFEARMGEEFEK